MAEDAADAASDDLLTFIEACLADALADTARQVVRREQVSEWFARLSIDDEAEEMVSRLMAEHRPVATGRRLLAESKRQALESEEC